MGFHNALVVLSEFLENTNIYESFKGQSSTFEERREMKVKPRDEPAQIESDENSDDDDDGDVDDWTVAAGLAGDFDIPYNVGSDVFGEAFLDSDTRVTRTAEMLQALCRLSAENFD
jgi:hypothetical protein